ncbi:MAG: hypothetical protein QOF85_416 [Solirubrobacterales bacterium]|jgi:hypothetical protein|nr:hypothetical protein [Solirubrobacterales bacterium]
MATKAQSHPTLEDARELLEWQPPLGVLSVYLRIDPADRSGAWRTELRNGLAEALQSADTAEHEIRVALRATAARVAERFSEEQLHSLPRGEVGFIEIARETAAERWWSTHLAPRSPSSVYLAGRPVLVPFLRLAVRSSPRGVALVSAERMRLLQWEPGHLEEVNSWELTLLSGDWRERKAPVSPDPARAQGASAAGRDQFGERLSENRHRFIKECGRLSSQISVEREWKEIIAFSPPQYVDYFRAGFHSTPSELVFGGEVDLIAEPAGQLLEIVEEAVQRRDAEQDRRLVERALEEARGGARGVARAGETLAALEESRVEHLIVDDARGSPLPVIGVGVAEDGERAGLEPLVRRALATAARVTPVSGDAADLLTPTDGVAALLRY